MPCPLRRLGALIENYDVRHLRGLLQRVARTTMIRGVGPRRVTGMVQKTLIASRSFQPGSKSTGIFAATARTSPQHATTLTQATTSALQSSIEISNFLKNH